MDVDVQAVFRAELPQVSIWGFKFQCLFFILQFSFSSLIHQFTIQKHSFTFIFVSDLFLVNAVAVCWHWFLLVSTPKSNRVQLTFYDLTFPLHITTIPIDFPSWRLAASMQLYCRFTRCAPLRSRTVNKQMRRFGNRRTMKHTESRTTNAATWFIALVCLNPVNASVRWHLDQKVRDRYLHMPNPTKLFRVLRCRVAPSRFQSFRMLQEY